MTSDINCEASMSSIFNKAQGKCLCPEILLSTDFLFVDIFCLLVLLQIKLAKNLTYFIFISVGIYLKLFLLFKRCLVVASTTRWDPALRPVSASTLQLPATPTLESVSRQFFDVLPTAVMLNKIQDRIVFFAEIFLDRLHLKEAILNTQIDFKSGNKYFHFYR